MKNSLANCRIFIMAICGLSPFLAAGQIPIALNGTWVIDLTQTEENMKRIGPPPNNANWLPSIMMMQCIQTMTFEGDNMIVDRISPNPMEQSFRLQQTKESTYTIETADGGKDTLTIAFLNKESITVKSAKVELDGYAVWKRGERPNRQTAEKDFKQAFDACVSVLKNVPFIKGAIH